MRQEAIPSRKCSRWFAWLLFCILMLAGVGPAFGSSICSTSDLADVPLELLVSTTKVPDILMISLDNHYTMDYSVMTDDSSIHNQFLSPSGATYGYILHGSNANGDTPIEDTTDSNDWKSQCSTFNKMYFNPAVTYEPWPTKPNADINAPQWDPQDLSGGTTYDLTVNNVNQDFGAGVPTYTWSTASSTTVDQTQSGDTWNQVAASVTADSDGTARIQVKADVTEVNTSTSNEFYAGPLKFVDQANGNKAAPTVIIPAPTSITPDTVCATSGTGCPWITQTTGNSTDGYYTGDLTDQVDNFTAVWDASGTYKLEAGHTYTVYAMWTALDQRSTSIEYDVMQKTPGTPINIIRRHFYMVSSVDNFPYLIELENANTAKFTRIDESKGSVTGQVEAAEMKTVTWADLPPDIQNVIPAPGAGAYTNLLQNFANWVTYHRKRIYAAQYAIAKLITADSFTNFLVGMETVPPSAQQGKTGDLWIKTHFNGADYDMTSDFLDVLYNLPAPHGNSGFSSDLWDIGTFFQSVGGSIANNNDKGDYTVTDPNDKSKTISYATTSANGSYPYFTEAYGGSCQQSFALVITDGASPSTQSIKNYDGCYIPTKYCGGVFGDDYDKTAADAAMYFYETDLKPDLSNNVPTNYIDQNSSQHMVVYGLSFGVSGPLYRSDPSFNALCATDPPANTCGPGCSCPTWTDPNNGGSVLDDLWHATVNSRGLFMYADNPEQLVTQLEAIKADIERRKGTAASVTTNSVQREIGTQIYQGFYDSTTWWGDLQAKNVDVATGAVGNKVWSAAQQLINTKYTDRKVFTTINDSPADFSAANASSIGISADQVNYILGDSSKEEPNGDFRARIWTDPDTKVDYHFKLGDIAHSEPFFFDGVVYIGANDGMLHAFDVSTGKELFAYVPSMVFDHLSDLTSPDFIDNHKFYVDGSPYVAKSPAGTVYLASGLGKGGKGVFCLKVNDATDPSASKIVNWEYTSATDASNNYDSLGYVYGKAYVAQTNDGNTVVIFGNGYVSDDGTAALYILDAADGHVIRRFDVGTGGANCNGMSSPALVDYDADGIVDYVYAGDLNGNLWKFDLTAQDPSNWFVAYGGHPLFTAKDTYGNIQPITSEPDVMRACDSYRLGVIVVFGTGQYLGKADLTSNTAQYQAIYGIYDWEKDLDFNGLTGSNYYLGSVVTTNAPPNGSVSLSNATIPNGDPVKLLEQDLQDSTGTYSLASSNTMTYYDPYDPSSQAGKQTYAGWFYRLPGDSERVVQDVVIDNGIVYAVSNTIKSTYCSGSGGGWLYGLDACTGGEPDKPLFDINYDNKVDSNDTVAFPNSGTKAPTGLYYDTTLFAPFVMQNILYIVNTYGNILTTTISANPAAVRFWRIIQ